MNTIVKIESYVPYTINRFHLLLRENTVHRFEDLVCPVCGVLLDGYAHSYYDNKYVTDEVMSALIEASMLREIHQYDHVD